MVTPERGADLAKEFGIQFFETSAKVIRPWIDRRCKAFI